MSPAEFFTCELTIGPTPLRRGRAEANQPGVQNGLHEPWSIEMTTATATTSVDKLIETVERMMQEVSQLRSPSRLENTPKRQREGMSARIKANNIERAAEMLRKYSEAGDDDDMPKGKLNKAKALRFTAKHVDHSLGYYVVVEKDEYLDHSPDAVAWREWWKSMRTAEDRVREGRAKRANEVRRLEEAVRFVLIPGFFPTPPKLIAQMLAVADIQPGHKCYDPSAGKGDILAAIREAHPDAPLWACEINQQLADICEAKGFSCTCHDFMAWDVHPMWDRILMNPPFENGQDRAHVQRAYEFLNPGGKLIAIMSAGSFQQGRGKTEFAEWLATKDHTAEPTNSGAFAGADAFRQTGVSTYLVVIDKPAA